MKLKSSLRKLFSPLLRRCNERLDIEYIDVFLPDLPEALEGFRITVVADLHMGNLREYHDDILQAVADTKPNLIAIAGDTMDEQPVRIEWAQPFFTSLSRLAPTAAILGNNDCLPSRIDGLRNTYRNAGIFLLEDEMRMLPVANGFIRIFGISDPRAQQQGIAPYREAPVAAAEELSLPESLPPMEKEGDLWPSLLLLHQPQLAARYASLHPSLIIAGHAHGGQFRLPFIGGLFSPGQGLFPKLISELYTLSDSQLLVSRGLGNHKFPLRINNRPHLPVAVLRRK